MSTQSSLSSECAQVNYGQPHQQCGVSQKQSAPLYKALCFGLLSYETALGAAVGGRLQRNCPPVPPLGILSPESNRAIVQ
eukprot:IDg14798t1